MCSVGVWWYWACFKRLNHIWEDPQVIMIFGQGKATRVVILQIFDGEIWRINDDSFDQWWSWAAELPKGRFNLSRPSPAGTQWCKEGSQVHHWCIQCIHVNWLKYESSQVETIGNLLPFHNIPVSRNITVVSTQVYAENIIYIVFSMYACTHTQIYIYIEIHMFGRHLL